MLRHCLALLAGAYALQCLAALPPDALRAPAFCISLAALVPRRTRLVAAALLGLCIAWQAADEVLGDRLPVESEGRALTVTGTVADFPEPRGTSLRLVLAIADDPVVPSRIRLSWYEPAGLPRLGETWTLSVRLRRPRGFSNPVGFDYEQWLFRQRIGATGYVVAHPGNRRLAAGIPAIPHLRQHVADRIVAVTGDDEASAVLQAIVVGARHRITQRQWDRFAASGTSHLMAISGLHIGLAAGGAWLLARILLAPLTRWRNLRDGAAMVALASAGAYAGLSGFAVPAQRALVMALVAIGAGLLRRQLPPGSILALAGIAVFLADPLAIMAPGFQLSFAAVAILLWSARQRTGSGAGPEEGARRLAAEIIYRLPPLQLLLLFGLLPLTVMSFGRVAWLAPLVNLVVLPLFNVVTVPAALLGALLDGPFANAGDRLLRISWYSIRSTLALLAPVADWSPARVQVATASRLVLVSAMVAALWAVLPPGWPGRKLAWLAALGVVLARPAQPPAGCVDITALDVGQGLGMVLRTRSHVLVFDTGPAFRSGGDTGALVLVPWLRTLGLDRVDVLVVSHADTDHAGGAASLAEAVPVHTLMSTDFIDVPNGRQLRCRRGQVWLRDGVRFSVLHPAAGPDAGSGSENDRSCVLEIAAGTHKALLTGDIESRAENRLLDAGVLSPTDLVVVPHHGSRTSSGVRFVRRLSPAIALVSAGFDNRWGLPKEDVVLRWREAGARVLNTATSGAVTARLCAGEGLVAVAEHRPDTRRYWHDIRP